MSRVFGRMNDVLAPYRWWPFILIALSVKSVFFIALVSRSHSDIPGYWGGLTGDSMSYIRPIDNLIDKGTYTPDHRMPGYGMPYFLFRLFFSRSHALNALLLLQLVVGSVSVVALAQLARRLTDSTRVFHGVFWVFTFSLFVSWYDALVMTESLTTALLILAVFLTLHAQREADTGYAIVAGAAITWAVFLRPIMFPVLLLILLSLWFRTDAPRPRRLGLCAAVLSWFVLFDGLWVARNIYLNNDPQPLTTTMFSPACEHTPARYVGKVVRAFGGNRTWWAPQAEIRWFNVRDVHEPDTLRKAETPADLPDVAYTSAFPKDSLVLLAKAMDRWYTAVDTPRVRQAAGAYVEERSQAYVRSYQDEHPWRYYVGAPLRNLGFFLFHDGTDNEIGHPKSARAHALKYFYSFLYAAVMLLGCLGAIHALFSDRWPKWARVVPFVLAYGTLVHPLVLRLCDHRYLVPFYPFALVMGAYLLHATFGKAGKWVDDPPLF